MKKYALLLLIMFISLIYSGTLHANNIFDQHSGSNDSTAEGWELTLNGSGVTGGENDGGTNAWYVDGNSTTNLGAGLSVDPGQGKYNNLQIAVAPEPISSSLFLIGGAILGFRMYRKQKTISR